MKIKATYCPKCKNYVYSRHVHDFRECPCKDIAIDGGQEDYVRLIFNTILPDLYMIELPGVDSKILKDDWNTRKDHFGILSEKDAKNYEITETIETQKQEYTEYQDRMDGDVSKLAKEKDVKLKN